MIRGFAILLVTLSSVACATTTATPATTAPVAEAPVPAVDAAPRPFGMALVDTPGCGGTSPAGGEEPVTTWTDDGVALNERVLWFSSRERLLEGPVEVELRGKRLIVWVETSVEPVTEQTTTCVHPTRLTLAIQSLPRAEYEWILRRGPRSTDVDFERDIAAADAARAAAAASETADDPDDGAD